MAGPGRRGRADKLTPAVAQQIVDAVRAGAYLKQAAEHAGVGEATVYRWLERADDPAAPEKFRAFRAALMRANADAEVGAIAVLRAAMPGDWRAALAFLKARFPDRWAERQRVEHSGPEGGPIRIDRVDEEVERLLEEAARRRSDGDAGA